MSLPYPPPFQDIATLAEHICASESTIEAWVKLGKLPPPKKINGGIRLWQWKEVERWLANDEADGAASDELREYAMQPDRPRAAKIKPHSFATVIRAYIGSPKFDALAAGTRENYRYILRAAEQPETLGAYPNTELRPSHIQAFLDGFADRPGQQSVARTALRAVEKWAIVRDMLLHPITLGTEVVGSDGGHTPWTDEQVLLAEREARPHLARIITIAANTGQRGSDIVRMRWSDIEEFDGRAGINVVQRKTGLDIWVPFTQEMMRAVGTWQKQPTYICLKEDGQPWTREQLSDQWLRERDRKPALRPLSDAGLCLHGLRATAVVRLRRAGATTPQISDMVGMSMQMVARYCRKSSQRENALAAVHYLDRTEPKRTLRQRSDTGS